MKKGKLPVPEPSTRKRSYKSGKVVWELRYQVGRGDERRTISRSGFLSKPAALRYFREFVIPAIERGFSTLDEYEEFQAEEKSLKKWKGIQLGTFVEEYINQNSNWAPRTRKNLSDLLRRASRKIGEHELVRRITTRQIQVFVTMNTEMGVEPANDTKLQRLRTLSTLFDFAVDQKIIDENPAKSIKKPRAKKGRTVYLTESECVHLLKVSSDYVPRNRADFSAEAVTALVATAIFTGMRKSEVLHLEWQDIDREDQRVDIYSKREYGHSTKSGENRSVGINPVLLEYLDSMVRERDERIKVVEEQLFQLRAWSEIEGKSQKVQKPRFLDKYERGPSLQKVESDLRGVLTTLKIQEAAALVFPSPHGKPFKDLPRAFSRVVDQADFKYKKGNVTFHVMRHTCASLLVMNGTPLYGVQKALGHKDIDTTMRYSHISDRELLKYGRKMPSLRSGAKKSDSSDGAEVIEIQEETAS